MQAFRNLSNICAHHCWFKHINSYLYSNIQIILCILQYNHDGIQKNLNLFPFEENGKQFGVISGENKIKISCI